VAPLYRAEHIVHFTKTTATAYFDQKVELLPSLHSLLYALIRPIVSIHTSESTLPSSELDSLIAFAHQLLFCKRSLWIWSGYPIWHENHVMNGLQWKNGKQPASLI